MASTAVALSPDGALLAAVNPDSGTLTFVDVQSLEVVDEVKVGEDPRTLAFTEDGRRVVVANRGSATVSVISVSRGEQGQIAVGAMPYGVVVSGRRAFVSEFAIASVAVVDLEASRVERRISVDPFPAGLALANGRQLLVTHFFSGQVTSIDVQTLAPIAVASTGLDNKLSQAIVVDPAAARAYLPRTRFNATNLARTFDTTIFPVVDVLDLGSFAFLRDQRISIDTADRPVNIPFAAALSPDSATLYVVNAGSDDLSVFDLGTGAGIGHLDVGSSPRGIAISPDGSQLFVNNVLDGTLSVVDTELLQVVAVLKLTDLTLEPTVLAGKRIFNTSADDEISTDRWISCATCHFDGGADGRTWLGFPDGPRNTPALFGVGETLPIHWSGDLDELQDVELTIRDIQFGAGLVPGAAHDSLGPPHAGLSIELDGLVAFMSSIEVPSSPFRADVAAIGRGRAAFEALGCHTCHVPPLYTDRQLHDVGTGDVRLERNSHGRGTNFDTPSLRAVWMTAPYFHDGSAATLEDVLETPDDHFVVNMITDEDLAPDLSPGAYIGNRPRRVEAEPVLGPKRPVGPEPTWTLISR